MPANSAFSTEFWRGFRVRASIFFNPNHNGMKCIVLDSTHSDGIAYTELREPEPGPKEVKVRIHAAALNHRDQWCREQKYPNLKDGVILGSDGAGEVVDIGSKVDKSWIGKQVLINPALNWGDNQSAQQPDFRILGMPDHGTFAEYCCVPADRVHQIPAHLDSVHAAALPLAGLTAYRALFYQGQIKKGDRLLVTGFGGGVAQLAVQFALASGARVAVSSGSGWKLEKALEMGVEAGYFYHSESWVEEAKGNSDGFDLIIDSAMGSTINDLLELVRPGGSIVVYGATLGTMKEVNARNLFWKQVRLQGSTMGSDRDFEQMLDLVSHDSIQPTIDRVFSLSEATRAFDKMEKTEQLGKLVLQI
ncbi:D-arabinose 1-dehydrogenase, Zn-dependent alcohol dehydrogenase family [Cyclobacterium xiamenense]|uniref:D-arabinose 1-dehydrogenase, Zn-dependent alcohol dehydrogenase family n=2 Tax=Cyclobacterium xiamenense TaxID=1297121 RepID=A0A1H7BDT8_9BACT|nr:D-arabinose 1-dehydrogenase, Zn-dependent alcohol dehydrogenase family [Cyclobacterium xiamenense]